jgi:hypothetical protein
MTKMSSIVRNGIRKDWSKLRSVQMLLSKDQIKQTALQLEPDDRETLAEDLLLSISSGDRVSQARLLARSILKVT